MDSWDQTYGVHTLDGDEGTFNDEFHTFGFYWDEKNMVSDTNTSKKERDTHRRDVSTGREGERYVQPASNIAVITRRRETSTRGDWIRQMAQHNILPSSPGMPQHTSYVLACIIA